MEANNMAAMCEALEKISLLSSTLRPLWKPTTIIVEIGKLADAALAVPARNCDVGSVDDQKDRFSKFCDDEKGPREHCRNCRLCNASDCELAWAQMPYKEQEGGAK